MLAPLSWLKRFVPKLPPTPQLVTKLMMHGLDVEGVSDGQPFDRVVVGEIVGLKRHPNADKLQLADVIIVPKGEPQEIVCGATNIAVGQKVPVALLGAKLPNGVTIESRSIRGVTSNGMLCAADELGLGRDHSGILILDSSLKVGASFADVIGDLTVLDLSTPANRADLMSMRGLAREIGAILGTTVQLPAVKLTESKIPAEKSVTLDSTDPRLCPLLTARVIRGLSQPPTPLWMVSRLRAAGMRSINVVADITNYIMLEYGQPLHAYDATKVKGQTLIARPARKGEQLVTLDGQTRTLTPEMLVIADAERAIGLAGVMGGQDTEVTTATTDVMLEAAIFDPVSIRRTSRQLGLTSEASKRFEKGLWPSLSEQASAAAAALLVELCGGTAERGRVHVGNDESKPRTITINPTYIAERLGLQVPLPKGKSVLSKLGFTVKGTAKQWTIVVPEWRLDVTLPEDIVDEVGRLVGYEKLPDKMPKAQRTMKEIPPAVRFKEELRNILVEMGFTEVISHAFYGEDNARGVQGPHFEVANPLDATQQKLRKSLLPQISDILKKEADAGHDAAIFEIGNIFNPQQAGPVERQQSWRLALGVTHKGEENLKKTVELLQGKLADTAQPESFTVAEGFVRGRKLEFCEFDLGRLMVTSKVEFGPWDPNRHIRKDIFIRQQSKYPAVTRDIAFWWPHDEPAIRRTVDAVAIDVLRDFAIKDRFTKDGRTSYAVTFTYQAADRTLTKLEVDGQENIVKQALTEQGAIIR